LTKNYLLRLIRLNLTKLKSDQHNFILSSNESDNKNYEDSVNLPVKLSRDYNFPSYLSGLIEGDGSIIVPGININSYKPYFEIVFHIRDLIIAEYIKLKIGGNIYIKENYCYLRVKNLNSVLKIIHLINGHMRTPKIEALSRMIEWYNQKLNLKLKLLDLDRSSLASNS